MSSFTTTFGNSPVSPADVSYAPYSFQTSLTLFWPQFSQGQTNVAARFMNMTATASSLNVFMPDATLNSVGYDAIVFNAGLTTFNVVTYGGTAIVTIAPGQTYYLMLNSNTTQNGGWQTVQFGVGTGSAVAAALAGAGLLAASGLLEVNLNGIMVSTSYTISSTQRAVLQVWDGGTGTITLPTAASVGNGFFFPLANNGSGSVTVATSGSDQIDGATTSVFSQTQSGFILSTGTSWVTVGKGIQNTFAVTLLNLNVAGSSDITLTSAQAQNTIQQYTGVLTGNINIIVPNTVQIYYVYNNTNGAFTLTVKTVAGTGIQVTQGQHAILYCDGTNVVNAFTAAVSSTIGIISGSSVSPSIFVQGSSSTGIYSPAPNQIAITANGFEVANFVSAATSVNYLQYSATATGNAPTISAMGADANIGIILSTKGSGAVGMASAVILGGLIDNTVIGSATPAAVTGTTITATTGFVGNLTGNVTGNITGMAPAGTLTGTTLASNVVTSSLTSVGTLATLTVTAPIVGSITGNAGTVTTNANLTGPVTSIGNATTITNNAVTTATINANAVTNAKLATSTANTLAGYDNSGNFNDVSIGTGLSLSAGSLSATVTGAMVLLSSQTIGSSTPSVSVTSGINSSYSHYVWEISNLTSVAGTAQAYINLFQGGAFVTSTSHYYAGFYSTSGSSFNGVAGSADTQFNVTGNIISINSSNPGTVRFEFWNPAIAKYSNVSFDTIVSQGNAGYLKAGGVLQTNAITTGIRLIMSTGNIATCTANLYGIT